MEQSPSREACSASASQEILRCLWKPRVHHRIYKSPPLAPILRQINSLLASILILSSHLHLGLPSGFLPSVYTSVSQTFFKWGPLLLARMFYGPPYSCPL
jgi:hypothetical protein